MNVWSHESLTKLVIDIEIQRRTRGATSSPEILRGCPAAEAGEDLARLELACRVWEGLTVGRTRRRPADVAIEAPVKC